MKRAAIVTAGVVSLFVLAACGGSPSAGAEGAAGTSEANLDVVHQTVLTKNPDGTISAMHYDVPVAQVEAKLHERALRRAALVSSLTAASAPVDSNGEHVGTTQSAITSTPTGNGASPASGCGDNDLWIYSTSNDCATIPRGTYQLCFNAGSNPGTADYLSAIAYPGPPSGDTWYQHVVTYSPGSESGAFNWDVPGDDGCWQSWGQDQYFGCYAATQQYGSNPSCTGYVGTSEVYM